MRRALTHLRPQRDANLDFGARDVLWFPWNRPRGSHARRKERQVVAYMRGVAAGELELLLGQPAEPCPYSKARYARIWRLGRALVGMAYGGGAAVVSPVGAGCRIPAQKDLEVSAPQSVHADVASPERARHEGASR